jgi:hypothetical protein
LGKSGYDQFGTRGSSTPVRLFVRIDWCAASLMLVRLTDSADVDLD